MLNMLKYKTFELVDSEKETNKNIRYEFYAIKTKQK